MHPTTHPLPALQRSRRLIGMFCLAAALWLPSGASHAAEAPDAAADPALEARVMAVAAELRCLVCQNQTIADSHAALAIDLRNQVREQLQRGDSPQQVIDYMTARYGDFVRYRPPLKASTALLWFGPAVLMAAGLALLVLTLRRRARLGDDHFEPDLPADEAQPPR